MDTILDELFEPLLNCSSAEVASIVTNVENISSRCDILKRLLTVNSPSPAYREWLSALLNRVSGELAPLRNRYVHDQWRIGPEETIRIDKRAKITKAQARQPDELVFNTEQVTPTDDIDKLTQRAVLILMMFDVAKDELLEWRRTGQPKEPRPQCIPASRPKARVMNPQEYAAAKERGLEPSIYAFD